MMKFVPVFAVMLCLAHSQRPPYAGSSNKWPVVLPQYLEGRETTAAPSMPTVAPNRVETVGNRIDANQELGNRISGSAGGYGGSVAPSSSGAAPSSADIPLDLPVDARGDIELINRIKTWPREKQPFWFINWQQIQEHRGDANNRGQATVAQVNTRSFFAG